jgi:hypothetical protein
MVSIVKAIISGDWDKYIDFENIPQKTNGLRKDFPGVLRVRAIAQGLKNKRTDPPLNMWEVECDQEILDSISLDSKYYVHTDNDKDKKETPGASEAARMNAYYIGLRYDDGSKVFVNMSEVHDMMGGNPAQQTRALTVRNVGKWYKSLPKSEKL